MKPEEAQLEETPLEEAQPEGAQPQEAKPKVTARGAVAVSIVTNNSAERIKECLSALIRSTQPPDLIVVFDNASEDETERVVSEFPTVKFIRSDQKRGFGANQNSANSHIPAHYDYIFILNDDAFVAPDCIALLTERLDEQPKTGAVSGTIQFPNGTKQVSGGAMPSIWLEMAKQLELGRLIGARIRRGTAGMLGSIKQRGPVLTWLSNYGDGGIHSSELRYVSGAALLVRADLFRTLGGFDERYRMYFEDVDLGLRILQKGFVLELVPEAFISHDVGAGTSSFHRITHIESALKFHARWNDKKMQIRLLSLVSLLKLTVLKRSGNVDSEEADNVSSQAKAILRKR